MRVLVDGLLYDGGGVERLVLGSARVAEIPTLLVAHPAIGNTTNGIKIDTQDATRLSCFRRFSRPVSDKPSLEQARKLEGRYKKAHIADEADFVTFSPDEFAQAVNVQRDKLLNLPVQRAPEAFKMWVRRAAALLIAKFGGAPVIALKERLLPYPPTIDGKSFLPLDEPSVDAALTQLLALNPEG